MPAALPFPTEVDDLTPEYLTAALRHGGHLANGSVSAVVRRPIGEGVGLVGQLVLLQLSYTGDHTGMPSSMVAKFASPYEHTRDLSQFFGFFVNEVGCYRQAGQAGGLGVPTAAMYVAEVSDDGRETLLLLGDLSDGRVGDQVAGATVADAEGVMDAAAMLHARWWASPELDRFSWLRPINNPAYLAAEDHYQLCWPAIVARYGDVVSPASMAVAEHVGTRIRALLHSAMDRPLTLAHTDFRLDNFFFDRPGAPVTLIDWQLTCKGVGMQDVSYFLVQSLDIDTRREHAERLARRWHDGLVDRGITGYSWDDAWYDFRRGVGAQMSIPVVAAGSMDAGNERGEQLLDAIVTRSFQALVDYEVAGVLPG